MQDTQMATRVTDGARRPRFACPAASPLPRACIALTKSEEKERLLAVHRVLNRRRHPAIDRRLLWDL